MYHFFRVPRNTVGTQPHQMTIQLLIIGRDGAAFSAGHRLDRMEAEAGHICQASHRLALIFRADGMRGILDQDQIVLLTDLPDLIQLHCLTGEIYRNDRFRPGCDQLADGRRIDIVGLRINICENRLRTRI